MSGGESACRSGGRVLPSSGAGMHRAVSTRRGLCSHGLSCSSSRPPSRSFAPSDDQAGSLQVHVQRAGRMPQMPRCVSFQKPEAKPADARGVPARGARRPKRESCGFTAFAGTSPRRHRRYISTEAPPGPATHCLPHHPLGPPFVPASPP